MTDQREALAQRILADARARAETIAHGGVRANMLLAAERRAERVRAGTLPVSGQLPVASPPSRTRSYSAPVARDLRDINGDPLPTNRRPCLRCRNDFDSTGPGNRMCDPCRGKVAEASPFAV